MFFEIANPAIQAIVAVGITAVVALVIAGIVIIWKD
jgi:hypothetical protein